MTDQNSNNIRVISPKFDKTYSNMSRKPLSNSVFGLRFFCPFLDCIWSCSVLIPKACRVCGHWSAVLFSFYKAINLSAQFQFANANVHDDIFNSYKKFELQHIQVRMEEELALCLHLSKSLFHPYETQRKCILKNRICEQTIILIITLWTFNKGKVKVNVT